jgi:hypothetical protein
MGLDTIELVLALEESFGITISDAEAQTILTTRQLIAQIYEKVRSDRPEDCGCLAMRAFFRIRKAFENEGVLRQEVRPETKLTALLPSRRRRDILSAVIERAGLRPLNRLPFGLQITSGRVRNLVTDAVITQHKTLRLSGYGWSKAQVREVVRAVMFAQLALHRFSDDAEIVKDLGVD